MKHFIQLVFQSMVSIQQLIILSNLSLEKAVMLWFNLIHSLYLFDKVVFQFSCVFPCTMQMCNNSSRASIQITMLRRYLNLHIQNSECINLNGVQEKVNSYITGVWDFKYY